MAAGDLTVFEEFAAQLGSENHSLNNDDTLKLALVTDVLTPLATASAVWATFSGNEVATGGNYVAGGKALTSVTYTEAAGVATLDAADFEMTQQAGGFTNARWAIIYNDDNATDMAICFIDLGGDVSEVDGPIAIRFDASGILTVTVS